MKRVLPAPGPLSQQARQLLERYVALLHTWNSRINLVSRREMPHLWPRHVADSIQLAPLLPTDGPVADLGSGAGFPGMVLACLRPTPITLVEADRRKAAFLSTVAGDLGLSHVRVRAERIEQVSALEAAAITSRALAPLSALLPLAYRHLAPGGVMVFPLGAKAEINVAAATAGWTMRVETFASQTTPGSVIVRLNEVCPRDAE